MAEERAPMTAPPQSLPRPARTAGDTRWFTEARFGLFIHWGLHTLAACHEWVKQRERLRDEEYDRYFRHFDPDLYDPARWARVARAAGMEYAVITTKHHEGFCLWDSALTDYKAPNTPAGRDLLRPFVDACRAEGLKIGFYHSLIDWRHPEFPVDGLHPRRDDEAYIAASGGRDGRKYAEYLHGQTRELLTGYGPIDILWFDFSYPGGPRPCPGRTSRRACKGARGATIGARRSCWRWCAASPRTSSSTTGSTCRARPTSTRRSSTSRAAG